MAQLYPFTDPVAARTHGPTVMMSGEGCCVTDTDGHTYLDAVSGLWCASLGFSNDRLIAAAEGQMRQLPYYHSFMGRSAQPTEQLAAKMASLLPGDLNHVFFGCSGSEAVDTAAKLVRYYWNARGRPNKKRIIARDAAYHGSGIISASLTGMSYCHDGFDLPDVAVLRTGRPSYLHDAKPGETERAFSCRRARELEALIEQAGADTIGAFIGEPVIGSGGVLPPPDGYWEEIQAVLARHDILLIADEIITGFGRTGAWFASEKYGLKPDLMTMAKQLTGAYFPLSALAISDRVHDAIAAGAHDLGTFGHGFTYGGHPVGCAVALEAIAIYEEMDLPAVVMDRSRMLEAALEPLKSNPAVADVRLAGLMAGVELHDKKITAQTLREAETRGVLLRQIGATLAISPPLIVSDEEIAQIVSVLSDSLANATIHKPAGKETA
ncbi:aminotransferase class III-fold pyridoxal phosphate-dependent enzyme [Leisingera daeponensis]|uniref:Aminotransferase class III-fold pyridoxal phosphate-dependent enzyme n=2 Tax=Leisingera daeponensis TaxID=405746 RepID=A0ABS7NPU3_9RHOB|nr:aminotransferase class III-fold pyridoxal phosphate-dependent enzyme [Leisingera daeponensis]